MAPSDRGLVGSETTSSSVQLRIGAPHKDGFGAKQDSGKPESDLGISPERRLPETLKSCRLGMFRVGMLPENRFSSRRRVRMRVKWLTVAGISPERLL